MIGWVGKTVSRYSSVLSSALAAGVMPNIANDATVTAIAARTLIIEIVRGKKRITGETALQLAEVLGTSADFWMRLESDYELNKARLARHLRSVTVRARGRTRAGLARHGRTS